MAKPEVCSYEYVNVGDFFYRHCFVQWYIGGSRVNGKGREEGVFFIYIQKRLGGWREQEKRQGESGSEGIRFSAKLLSVLLSVGIAHIVVLVLLLVIIAATHGHRAIGAHSVVAAVKESGRQSWERWDLESALAGKSFQDLESSPDLLVLKVNRFHKLTSAVHVLDLVLELLDIGLATITKGSLGSPILGSTARVGDVAGAVWEVRSKGIGAVIGLLRGFPRL